MGSEHPFIVVGKVKRTRRPLAALRLRFAQPDEHMLQVASQILKYLRENHKYRELDLALAATIPDHEWTCNMEDHWRHMVETDLCKMETKEQQQEQREQHFRMAQDVYMPRFPFIHTCLLLGAISCGWESDLHRIAPRPWNSAPDWGGDGMWKSGCTVVDATDLTYCFVLPNSFKSHACTPLSGRQWLSVLGKDTADDVNTNVPVMLKKDLQEVWPSFVLRDPVQKSNGKSDDLQKIMCGIQRLVPAAVERVHETIERLLKSDSSEELATRERDGHFLRELEHYTREHPEQFASGCVGAVPLLLAALTRNQGQTTHLKLHYFNHLSGDQVVGLVKAVVARNATQEARQKPLIVLDISFNHSVELDHIAQILDVTDLEELLIWRNRALPVREVAKLAGSRIAKTTTCARFMKPLETWVIDYMTVDVQPAPPMPAYTHIRQVVWMSLATTDPDARPPADEPVQLECALGRLTIEQLSVEAIAKFLQASYYKYDDRINAELLVMPLQDTWAPLAEIYTSLARIENFMANESIEMEYGEWKPVIPLMMATGSAESEYAISSPIPAEAFCNELWNMDHTDGPRTRPLDAMTHGEYTMVLLQELDLGRLRYGLVTRDAAGRLQVFDPAAVVGVVGPEARRAWEQGIGALPAWSDKKQARSRRGIMLLDTTAVEKIYAASAEL